MPRPRPRPRPAPPSHGSPAAQSPPRRGYQTELTSARTNSQKPNAELLENFRAAFPHLAQTSRSQSLTNPTTTSLTDALDVAHTTR